MSDRVGSAAARVAKKRAGPSERNVAEMMRGYCCNQDSAFPSIVDAATDCKATFADAAVHCDYTAPHAGLRILAGVHERPRRGGGTRTGVLHLNPGFAGCALVFALYTHS